jgi:cell division control protein 6
MAGRDQERATLEAFVSSFGNADAHTTLYISGSPGTGKTALVNSVLRDLDVNIISINCMALNSVDALWERLLDDLESGKKNKTRIKKTRGKDAVEKMLCKLDTNL